MSAQAGYLGSVADATRLVSDETRMLLQTAERVLRDSDSVRRFRAARGGAVVSDGIWPELCSLGLIGACAPARAGGSELPPLAGVLVAETFGRQLAPEPYVAAAFLPALALAAAENEDADRLLSAIVDGEATAVLALQEKPGSDELAAPDTQLARRGDGFVVRGRKRFVHGGAAATHFVFSAVLDGELCLAVAPRDAAGLAVEPRAMADGTQAADLRFDDCVLPASAVIVRGNRAPEILNTTLAWAHVSISAELFGLATALFGITIDYLRTRTQFDAPLASFQALQHRAADLYCGKEIARFNIAQAASALETANGAALATASRCKARAADAAMQIAREAVQLHGAIGFSDEADVGLYLKRIMVLAAWLGGADHHRRQYARLNPYRLD